MILKQANKEINFLEVKNKDFLLLGKYNNLSFSSLIIIIIIKRCILKDSEIIILDEATSSLDSFNEK